MTNNNTLNKIIQINTNLDNLYCIYELMEEDKYKFTTQELKLFSHIVITIDKQERFSDLFILDMSIYHLIKQLFEKVDKLNQSYGICNVEHIMEIIE